MKYCKKCDSEKPESEFSKHKGRKDGLQAYCKSCISARQKMDSERIAEYKRAWTKENKDKIAAQKREYNQANADRISEKHREYYAENAERIKKRSLARYYEKKESIAAQKRQYNAANKDKRLAKQREYNAANPEMVSAYKRNYKALKRSATGSHTAADVIRIFEDQRGLCATCETKLFKSGKKKFHVDHIHPLSKGGTNDKYNLQCLCPECNLRKSNKDPLDWAGENGKLV